MASTWVFGRCCRTLMAAAKGSSTSSAPASSAAAPKGSGILKPVPVSAALGEFLGVSEVSRANAVKKVWEYIKTHNLQSPSNKKEIFCDEKLKTIFNGKDCVGFLEIARLMSQHFQKAA